MVTAHPDEACNAADEQRERERAEAAKRAGAAAPLWPVQPLPYRPESIQRLSQPRVRGRLALDATDDSRFLLRDDHDGPVGRISRELDMPPRLEAADGAWQSEVSRQRLSWQLQARSFHVAAPVADYHPAWFRGGRLWLAPDSRYGLRARRGV